MQELVGLSVEKTAAFSSSQEVHLLKEAAAILESVDVKREHDPIKRSELRRRKLEAWLRVASQIDQNIDPKFNPKDAPVESLVPPVSGGVSLSGNAPSNVKDPAARAEFQRAVDENTRKTVHYTFQWQLHRLDERATPALEEYVRLAYSPTDFDRNELVVALKRVAVSGQRAARLLSLIALGNAQ